MTTRAYFAWSALLGIAWGALALAIMSFVEPPMRQEWRLGGLCASPFIGVLAGALYRPVYRRRLFVRILASGATLYLTAACFAAAGGLYHLISVGGDPLAVFGTVWVPLDGAGGHLKLGSSFVTTPVFATLWGLTFAGYALLLWPASFYCHRQLGPRGGPPTSRCNGRSAARPAAERQPRWAGKGARWIAST